MTTRQTLRLAPLLVPLLVAPLVAPPRAYADPPVEPASAEAERPWAAGVAEADRHEALRRFQEGNELFAQSEYAEAARRYREALAHWDHPAIRGNLAVALIHLEDPLGAYDNLERALRFGAAPFEPHVYQQLTTHFKLLSGRIARIAIDCTAEGAAVALDGAALLACPGRAEQVVLAGPHQVVARKRGHLTFTREFDARPGAVTAINVVLQPLDAVATYERRWPAWRPWAVLGAGVLVTGVGVSLQLVARDNMSEFEAEIGRLCSGGCREEDLPDAVWAQEDRARTQNRLALGAFVVGGAGVLAGTLFLVLNQPRRVRLDESGHRLGAGPLGGGAWGLTLSGSF